MALGWPVVSLSVLLGIRSDGHRPLGLNRQRRGKRSPLCDSWVGASMRAFVKPPLNSDIQWFSGSSPRDMVVVTSLSRLLLVVGSSSRILRCKVGVSRATEPVARSNFYPCRHQAGHHIPHTRKAPGPHPCYQRAPSMRTVAHRRPAAVSGALTFNAHDASFSAMFNNVLCLPADGFELRPVGD